jgi:uncharacterized glyoxalase superfamily protein PhnB
MASDLSFGEIVEKPPYKGAKGIKEPETKPWGQIVAYVEDDFGTIVEICTPMG